MLSPRPSSMPTLHANPGSSCVIRICSTGLLTTRQVTQEDGQTQCLPDNAVPGCGSARSKVIGDFDTEVADAPGFVFADVKDTKGTRAAENRKNATGNTGKQYQLVTFQVLDNSNKKYKCDLCDQGFAYSNERLRHKERYHTTNKPECRYCGKTFQYRESLEQHEKANIAGRKIQYCDQCEQKFCTNMDLVQHKKQVHDYQPEFKCNSCCRRYTTLAGMLRHSEKVHDPKQCMCPVCNKIFSSIYRLKAHTNRHNEVANIKCDYCVKLFKSKDTLRKHLKRCHTDKPADIKSTKTNWQLNKEPNVNPVSEHQKEISKLLEKQDTDGSLAVDKAHPVIRQPSTNTGHVDNPGMEQECDSQMKGWIATCPEWIIDKSDTLYDDVFLGVNNGAMVDFDDEDVADSSDKGITGFNSETIADFGDESMADYL